MNLLVILTVVEVVVALALIGLVLLQQGKGADAGAAFGGGASGTVFGASGSANFLSRATAILAVAFFALTLTLAYLAGQVGGGGVSAGSVTDQLEAPAEEAATDDVLPAPVTNEPATDGAEANDAEEAAPADAAAPAADAATETAAEADESTPPPVE